MVDAGGGVVISTSVFEDQSGAEESNRRAADYVQQNLSQLLPNPPQITAREVVAHKATALATFAKPKSSTGSKKTAKRCVVDVMSR